MAIVKPFQTYRYSANAGDPARLVTQPYDKISTSMRDRYLAASPYDLVRIILHGHEDSTHVALGAEVRWHRVAPSGTHVVGVRFTGTTALLAGKLLGLPVSTGIRLAGYGR